MAFIGLNIKRQNLFPNNFWTPGGSQKGPTRVCPCVCPFIQTFSRKRIIRFIRSPVDAVRDKVGFFKKRPPKWDVFDIIEKFCRFFFFFFSFCFWSIMIFYSICYYLLYKSHVWSGICGKLLSSNQITDFLNHLYLEDEIMKQSDFFHVDTNS